MKKIVFTIILTLSAFGAAGAEGEALTRADLLVFQNKVLGQMSQGFAETNERIGQTNERLGQTNERIGKVEATVAFLAKEVGNWGAFFRGVFFSFAAAVIGVLLNDWWQERKKRKKSED